MLPVLTESRARFMSSSDQWTWGSGQLTHGTHHVSHHTDLGVLAQLYPDLLAAAVQRPARDAELGGGLLDRHPAPDGLERSVEVILGSEVSVRG